MPIYPVPPEIQALVSGTPGAGIQPTLGNAFNAMVGSAKQEGAKEQDAQRTLFEGLSRQTPGFAEYIIANHPDLIDSLTKAPRLFRGKGEPGFGDRLKEAMTAFRSQPAPAEAPVSGAESATIRKDVQAVLEKDANWGNLTPEQQGQAFVLADHMRRATSSEDASQAYTHLRTLLGKEPTEEMQKYAGALGVLNDPALGYTDAEKAATAAGYALGKTIDPEDKRVLDWTMALKAEKLRDLEIINKTQDNARQANEAAHGKAIPINSINDLSGLDYVSRRVVRAAEMIKRLGVGETNIGNLLRAPAYSQTAAEYNALLNDLGEDVIRFTKDIRGRVSAGLLTLLKDSLMSYDKTPTQLRGVLNVTVSNVLDRQEAILEQLQAAGVGSDVYFDTQEKMLQPLRDLQAAILEERRKHPEQPVKTWRERLFGGGTPTGPGAAPVTPEDVLFGETPGTPAEQP